MSSQRGAYTALAAALLGWLFDGMEMGIFSMVGRQAVQDLLHTEDPQQVGYWFGVIIASFLVGAATGGVVFGWLGDRIGRVGAMTLSVLTYALFTCFCGFSNNVTTLGILRFLAALGMGGEWALGVALVMEIWPNKSRPFMAGLIGAAANAGYLLVGVIGLLLASMLTGIQSWLLSLNWTPETVEWLTGHQGWRLMMFTGGIPAVLTFLITIFVPESEKWKHEKKQGGTSHWATVDLLGVLVGACGPGLIIWLWAQDANSQIRSSLSDGIWTVVLIAGSIVGLIVAFAGYIYPVRSYLRRWSESDPAAKSEWKPTLRRMMMGAALSGVALLGTWGSMQWAPAWASKMPNPEGLANAKEYTQIWSAIGAIVGTILAALAGDWVGRRITYAAMCVTSIAALLWLYRGLPEYGTAFLVGTFVAGLFSAAFYGWLPLYLPELFRTKVRATGQGFSFNFGRIIAAIGTLQVGNLFAPKVALFGHEFEGGYPFACSFATVIYVVGFFLIWFAPETKGKPLPE